MKYFRAFIECGHAGAGNSRELVVYFTGADIMSALKRLKASPGIKHKWTVDAIKSIEPVSRKKFYCRMVSPVQSAQRWPEGKRLRYFQSEPLCACRDESGCSPLPWLRGI